MTRRLEACAKEDLSQWSMVITPKHGWFDLRWSELWRYRDLILLFVRRDFVATYKQTILGPVWFLIQPVMTTLMFTLIFGHIAKLSTDKLPPILFYMAGIVAWGYFSDCVNKTANTFTRNAGIFGKVYFPRLAVPVAIVVTNLLSFLIQFTMFMGFLTFFVLQGYPVHPSWRMLVAPVLVVEMAALGLGVGCIVSSLTTRYRDLAMALTFGVQIWMYASSVVYPLSVMSPAMRKIMILNPMVPIIEAFRFSFLGAGVIEIWQLLVSFAVSTVVLLLGIVMFKHVEHTVMDTI
jgi:lipopolysaccharide transport system permease protein